MLTRDNLEKLYADDRIHFKGDGQPFQKQYADEYEGALTSDLWLDVPIVAGNERIGYPTQKPIALLERIIAAPTIAGNIVLDPFCGSGTTGVAAIKLGRQFIGIDASKDAVKLANERIAECNRQSQIPQ